MNLVVIGENMPNKIALKILIVSQILFLCITLPGYAEGKYKILSVTYELTDDNDFSGEVLHQYEPQEKIEFKIRNISKNPFNFEKAEYFAVKKDKSIHRVEFDNFSNPNMPTAKTYLCNPDDTVSIVCTPSKNLRDLLGFFVKLGNGRKIYFEYEELSNGKTFLRKTLGAIGIKKNMDKNHPPEEGWKKSKTSSGNIFYYKDISTSNKTDAVISQNNPA